MTPKPLLTTHAVDSLESQIQAWTAWPVGLPCAWFLQTPRGSHGKALTGRPKQGL